MKKQRTRGNHFAFILYPENDLHRAIYNFILDEKVQFAHEFEIVSLMHDRSKYTEGLKKGQLKKKHIHVMMKTKDRRTADAVAKMFGGERPVLRLYQRDNNNEWSTKLANLSEEEQENEKKTSPDKSKKPNKIVRKFSAKTGKEYPVIVDQLGEARTVDIDIPDFVLQYLEYSNQQWNSLPQCFYDFNLYPMFKCADNQYWKFCRVQNIQHVEVVSDPKAYYKYLMHVDFKSVMDGKEQYSEEEIVGSDEYKEELKGNRGLKYNLSRLLELFKSYDIKNARQALDLLTFSENTDELLEFYFSNASRFTSYFHGLMAENSNSQDPNAQNSHVSASDNRIKFMKENRKEKEHEKAKKLSARFEELTKKVKDLKRADEPVKREMEKIGAWFNAHPSEQLFKFVPLETQLEENAFYKQAIDYFSKPVSDEPASEPVSESVSESEPEFTAPLIPDVSGTPDSWEVRDTPDFWNGFTQLC